MDKSLFISGNGARLSMRQLEIVTNNLANANTTAFRADSSFLQQVPVSQHGMQSRTFAKLTQTYTDFKQGPIVNTEHDLDVALNGPGFIAVQSKTGKEGYTRAGNLVLTPDGLLMTQAGHMVMGNAGVISVPPSEKIVISPDGTVSARLPGTPDLVQIDRIKLTNPDISKLTKGTDSLFYMKDDNVAQQDTEVKLVTGALEGSNVNVIDTMVQLIDLSRHYEIHTNYMKTLAENTSKANQILEIGR